MLRFQYSSYLGAFVLLPLLVALFVAMLYWRRKRIEKIGTLGIVQQQIIGFIPARATLKFVLMSLVLGLVILGTANLQKGGKTETVQRKGVDVMIALDVSKSMLAKDIQPDRLTRAKQFITRLTDKMSSDRIGLVIFAGRSYLQVPLTVDYSAMKLLLQTVSPDMVPTQGTVIGDAIEMADQSFSNKERKFKSIIIISDGEDHDETAIEKVKEATEKGSIVHTIGIGSPQGTQLFDPTSNAPKLDEQGNPVITKLNENELKSIAAAGNGTYTLLGNVDVAADHIIDELDGMEQRNIGAVVFANYISYFQYFLLVALLLLIIEWILPGAKKPHSKSISTIIKTSTGLLLIFFTSISQSSAQSSKKLIASGNKLYAEGKYKDAATKYSNAIQKDTTDLAKGTYNLGNALYQQKQIEPARKAYEIAAKKYTDPKANAAANYNIGNTYMSEKKWEEAIDAYKKTLRNTPQDADAKYNLSYAQAMLKKEGGGKNKNKEDKKEDDKKEQNKKEEQDKKEQQPKDGDQKKEEEGKPQAQPSKLSEKQAEQLLDALQQEEKKLQEKNKKRHGTPVKMEKDW